MLFSLYLLLQRYEGIRAAEFSSQLNETQRKGILRDLRNDKFNLLIATDAMSRGMDIRNVDLVVNYDAPNNAKTYVHRVGRTARGGEKGRLFYSACFWNIMIWFGLCILEWFSYFFISLFFWDKLL